MADVDDIEIAELGLVCAKLHCHQPSKSCVSGFEKIERDRGKRGEREREGKVIICSSTL